MPASARDRMIGGAVRLLAQRGLQATSFSEVIAATGAPRGSIYHHFPGGKDQLVRAAIGLASDRATAYVETARGRPADEVTGVFLDLWREVLTRSQLGAGCAVLAVTVATDSADLLAATAEIFRGWRTLMAGLLVDGGLTQPAAESFGATLIAAAEGAVVLARAEQDLAAFELVAGDLVDRARGLLAEAQAGAR